MLSQLYYKIIGNTLWIHIRVYKKIVIRTIQTFGNNKYQKYVTDVTTKQKSPINI